MPTAGMPCQLVSYQPRFRRCSIGRPLASASWARVQPCSCSFNLFVGFLGGLGALGSLGAGPPPSSSISLAGPPPSPQGKHFHRMPSECTQKEGLLSPPCPGRGQRNL